MPKEEEPKKILDCQGKCCSLPLVEARMQLDKMRAGETLEVIVDSVSAEYDMKILSRIKGYGLVRSWQEDGVTHFLIKKR